MLPPFDLVALVFAGVVTVVGWGVGLLAAWHYFTRPPTEAERRRFDRLEDPE